MLIAGLLEMNLNYKLTASYSRNNLSHNFALESKLKLQFDQIYFAVSVLLTYKSRSEKEETIIFKA